MTSGRPGASEFLISASHSVGLWPTSWNSLTGEQGLGGRGLCAALDEGLFWAVGKGREDRVEEEE